ncbi:MULTISPECIES: DUF924 family protein [Alteromonas]|uniref:DUF924 domain-containing protein n=1 Tax=Alteromonas stellipolaris TaxID=233316 RepID=A0ABM5YIB9_9ALTE|nr:DUF924 family protein [Alteromonas stellipolaris]ALM91010.1 hypothetical protein AOR13_1980 [Alteromonas stellipolaris LMG 21856]AMJ74034.1 hypothetical protein AVL57_08625 [Alteromonas stellipolaris]
MDKSHLVIEESSRVLEFWFNELTPSQWFTQDSALDRTIASQFLTLHRAASQGELWPWRATPTGRLAEILLLDQFSRNIYRDTPHAFSQDPMALVLAQEAVSVEADKTLTPQQCIFLYMPFMHSESLAIHDVALQLFAVPGLEQQYDYELKHFRIIEQFGRYPHRNLVLGRTSTKEEELFLSQSGSRF